MRGGFAESCLVGADYVIKLPDDVPMKLGAAFPVAALTSYQFLLKHPETPCIQLVPVIPYNTAQFLYPPVSCCFTQSRLYCYP